MFDAVVDQYLRAALTDGQLGEHAFEIGDVDATSRKMATTLVMLLFKQCPYELEVYQQKVSIFSALGEDVYLATHRRRSFHARLHCDTWSTIKIAGTLELICSYLPTYVARDDGDSFSLVPAPPSDDHDDFFDVADQMMGVW